LLQEKSAYTELHTSELPPSLTGKSGPPNKSAAASAALWSSAAVRAAAKGGAGDELNLAVFLNVLDGVVDTPGRLVIMTTNHPERLDPALIRPGRINKQVYMGNIAAAEALKMVQHYFGDLQVPEERQLLASWVDGVVSPAALEALCAEYDSVAELLHAVAKLVPAAAEMAAAAAAAATAKAEIEQQQQDLSRQADQQQSVKAMSGGSTILIRAASCTASFLATSFEVPSCSGG